jgi:hypothetical protein
MAMTRRLGIATAMLLFACCPSFAQQTSIFGAGVPNDRDATVGRSGNALPDR